jgi:hypothetical protein
MTEITLEFLAEQIKCVLDEQRAARGDVTKLRADTAELRADVANEIAALRATTETLRDDVNALAMVLVHGLRRDQSILDFLRALDPRVSALETSAT